jgi:hypothetical protein
VAGLVPKRSRDGFMTVCNFLLSAGLEAWIPTSSPVVLVWRRATDSLCCYFLFPALAAQATCDSLSIGLNLEQKRSDARVAGSFTTEGHGGKRRWGEPGLKSEGVGSAWRMSDWAFVGGHC